MRKIIILAIFIGMSSFAVAGGEIEPDVVIEPLGDIGDIDEVKTISKIGEVYVDHRSELMWQDEPYGDIEDGAYKHNKSEGKAGIWSYSKKYCEELYYAGYSDWRLPKVSELAGLYSQKNHLKNNIAIDFWTSTPSKGNNYYTVYAIMDGLPYEHKKIDTQYIRCVRSIETKRSIL